MIGNIIIAGGVAGGMSCATRLRRLAEQVNIIVIEKGPFISYANCGIPYALGGVIQDPKKLHVQTPENIQSWFGIDVRTNSELLEINRQSKTVRVLGKSGTIENLPYDKLVLAIGAEPVVLPLPGMGSKHVFGLETILDLQNVLSYVANNSVQHASVIGGGFIGLEAAENMRNLGLEVTIFERLPHVFPPVDPDIAEILHQELRNNGVNLELGANVVKITEPENGLPGMVFAENRKPTAADLIITAVGIRARSAIPKAAGLEVGRTGVTVNHNMQTSDPDIYAVGDMVETPHRVANRNMQLALAGPANRQGRMVADHICDRETQYRGNVGTSICKVFKQTVGLVGLSTHSLTNMGIPFRFVTIHPPQHAGYYPDAIPMTIKVAFEDHTGRILGAQIIGSAGVDKRIDVMATAMQAGMTIEDLEHLELSYAPPYGAAKDPVNMVGFVGSNVLQGIVEIVHAADFDSGVFDLDKFLILDVRTPEEFNAGHIRGATNIPLSVLRHEVKRLDKTQPVLSYCWVGYRGYIAYRILKQLGFQVFNLDGGFKAVCDGRYESFL